jgi:hypothetical protein
VLEYWLDHAEGFEIRRRRRVSGHVESVLVDSGSGRAQGLVVRSSRLGRTRVIPAESIVAVEPFERVLVPRRESSALARIGLAIRTCLVAVAAGARRAAVRLAPRVARGSRAASAAVVAAAAWAGPRAWRLTRTTAARCASGAQRAARATSLAVTSKIVWLRPRLSSLTRAAAAGTAASARRGAAETRAAGAWLQPRARSGARSVVSQTHAAAAWLAPRVKASMDAAGTGTPSAWHLPIGDPTPDRAVTRKTPSGTTNPRRPE